MLRDPSRRSTTSHGQDDWFLPRFLTDNRGLLANLRRDHYEVDSYCATCGGPQSGRHRYPCQIRDAIDEADRRIDEAEGFYDGTPDEDPPSPRDAS